MLGPVQLLALTASLAVAEAAVPPGFSESQFASGLSQATGLEWAPDETRRLFVTEKTGAVRIVDAAGNVSATPFATEAVYTNSECGLIGLAFDPAFIVNHFVYLFVTVSASEQRIIRYTDTSSVGTARTVIVPGLPTNGNNHDGGGIGFGWDGKLYWSIGDLGNGTGVDANLSSLAAKVGRANRDGTPVFDNPFVDGPGGNNDFIYARGHRNPFTLTFRPDNGELWVNTVGTSYEQVFVVSAGSHAGYNDYEANQPAGFLRPVIAYRTNGSDPEPLTSASRASGVATYVVSGTHRYFRGTRVTISGVADASFDGDWFVADVPASNSFTVAQPGPDASSSGGGSTTLNQGGSLTGGVFYDATLFPADYRGNFLYGDYNSGRLMRAELDGVGVSAVDYWASGYSNQIDLSVGPDGALYAVTLPGNVWRVVPSSPGPKLVLSRRHLRIREGSAGVVWVSLGAAPAAAVSVSATPTGDTDVTVASGGTLTFTSADWATPQPIRVAAGTDADATDDVATLAVVAAGYTSEDVAVTVGDEDTGGIMVSTTAVSVPEGSTGTFTVAFSQALTGPVTVSVARTSGDPDVTVAGGASLSFDASNATTPQTVSVAAAGDVDGLDDIAVVTVSAPGYASRTVTVTVQDDDPLAPTFVSTPVATAVLGAPWVYDAEVLARPAATFSLVAGPPGMQLDAASGRLTWTPDAIGTFTVSLSAQNGVAPDALQTFDVTVTPDQPPQCVLTRPLVGDAVSGLAEFFGDGVDDVGTIRAEFFVDGELSYSDENDQGHYHFGGRHLAWDTTGFSEGVHSVAMRVVDTAGQSSEPCTAWVRVGDITPVARGCACGASPVDAIEWVVLLAWGLRVRGARRARSDAGGAR